jgi:hypothetical protein
MLGQFGWLTREEQPAMYTRTEQTWVAESFYYYSAVADVVI